MLQMASGFDIQRTVHRDILIIEASKMHYFSNSFW